MKSQLMLLAMLSVAYSLPAGGEDGRYIPDTSGQYYHNPNEGRYIPDPSGNYRHDGLGGYSGDAAGRYAGQKDPYSGSKYAAGGFGNLVGANTFQSSQVAVRPAAAKSTFGNQPSATSNVDARLAKLATGVGRYNDEGKWKIIRQVGDVDLDGYHWEYLTENGINAEESGKLFNKGTDAEAIRAKGFFTYTGPDNVEYHITYTADENGFVPEGAHLPTPPPVPEAILRSLDYQRSIGKL